MNETCNGTIWEISKLQSVYEQINYVPFLFAVIALPVEFISCRNMKSNKGKQTALNKAKTLSNIYLIGHTITLCLMSGFNVIAVLELMALISTLIIMRLHHRKGIVSSGCLFIFWLLYSMAFTLHMSLSHAQASISFTTEIIKCSIIALMFLLNCFADVKRKQSSLLPSQPLNISPENSSSFLNRMFFYWFIEFAWRANKKPIMEDDVWELNGEHKSQKLLENFHECSEDGQQSSIVWSLAKTQWSTLLYTFILRLSLVILFFVCPILLKYIINYTKSPNRTLCEGTTYAILLFVVSILVAIVNGQYLFEMNLVRLRMKSILMNVIYRKSLKLHHSESVGRGSGNIVNLMSNDSEKFVTNMLNIHLIWSGPLIILISAIMLSNLLGILPALSGMVIMALVIPSNLYIGNKLKALQKDQMLQKDERIKFIHETIEGIKLIKLYAWEEAFQEQIGKVREAELNIVKKSVIFAALSYISWILVPFFVALASFTVFVLINSHTRPLTIDLIFVGISLFNLMKYPLQMFPTVITGLIEAWESLKRIDDFLVSKEYDNSNGKSDDDCCWAVKITDGNFKWNLSSKNNTLKNINVRFKKGSLAIIIGNTAQGKSSLLSAVLGEINRISGDVFCNGSLAFVSQEAWIQSGTVQENILFGKSLNELFYDEVITACSLDEDLRTLPKGSHTEIGERGMNLSGGQKQRIALARAIYSNADIYLFDDPLSAVDAHVKKQLFERIMSNQGILKSKTRLLVTNEFSILNQADQILMLKNGELIKDIANFNEANEKQMKNLKLSESIDWTNIKKEIVEKSLHNEIKTREQITVGKVTLDVYLSYFKYVGYKLTGFAIFMNILYQIASLSSNVWLSYWNGSVGRGQFYSLFIYLVLGIFQSLSLTISTVIISYGGLASAKRIFNDLLQHTLRLPLLYFFGTPSGNILNRFTNDIQSIDSTLPTVCRDWIGTFFTVLTILLLFSIKIPVIIIFLIPIFIIYYFVLLFYLKSSRLLKRMELNSLSPVFSFFTESLNGKSIIKAFGHEERFANDFTKKIDNHQKFAYLFGVAERCLGVILEIIGSVIIFLVTLFAAYYVEEIGAPTATLLVTYGLQIIPYLNLMLRTSSSLETNIVAVERILQFNTAQEEPEEKNSQVISNWPSRGRIKFQNFSMKYRDDADLVLNDISIEFPALTKTSVIGRTAAGKSSLILSLFRIAEPTSGSIQIDGINIAQVNLKQIRRSISIIPQDPVLFTSTIRFNIDPLKQFGDADIWHVLEICGLKEFCQTQPAQLFQNLERGENISLGQKQLFCLARALLRQSKILILDEATSSLDLNTNEILRTAIKEYCKKSTVIEVVHALKSTVDSDKILVMEESRIVEDDSPENLLNDPESRYSQFLKQSTM